MVNVLNPVEYLHKILKLSVKSIFGIDDLLFGTLASSLLGVGGSMLSDSSNRRATANANRQNIEFQKEFAKHGIQWKVEDAKQAGIHPLAALGAQTVSFSPSVVGHQSDKYKSMGSDLGKMVKDIYSRSKSDELLDKAIKVATLSSLTERNQNDGKKPNQGNIEVQPARPTAMGQEGFEAGINPVFRYGMYPNGWIAPIPTQDVSELISEGSNPIKWRYWRDWATNSGRDIENYRAYSTEEAKRWREFLTFMRPKIVMEGKDYRPLKSNEEYRYKVGYGFKLFKKKNEMDSYFYVDKRGGINNANTINFKPIRESEKRFRQQKSLEKINWEKYPRKYNTLKKIY